MQLHIPQPCHQRFSEMTPSSEGRYCQSCHKTVVDFTTFSNAELIAYFQQHISGVCGRLTQYQLDNKLQPARLSHSRISIAQYIIGLGLSLFIPSKKMHAALVDTLPVQTPVFNADSLQPLSLVSHISGKIFDVDNNPVAGALIMLKATTLGTITGQEGEFVLNIPDSLQKPYYMVDISSIGFLAQTIGVSYANKIIRVKLEYLPDTLLGEVIFVGGICVKRTRWQKIKDWFRRK